MKRLPIFLIPFLLVFISAAACRSGAINTPATSDMATNAPDTMSSNPTDNLVMIRIGTSTFTAALLNNPTAAAFKAQLPITVSMSELNGNEKFYTFPKALPTNASNPGTIQTGDLMLYGSTTLVLFYQSFSTSYSYTKLGRINDPAGLAAALGSGSVTVTFEMD